VWHDHVDQADPQRLLRVNRRTAIDDALAAWLRDKAAKAAAAELVKAGIRAAALATSLDLVNDDHLRERGFWEPDAAGVLPGLP
jgi:crotonobetainyl-CoA:carnitine CoA-transferase CaiB-like acyl-CoA transferase